MQAVEPPVRSSDLRQYHENPRTWMWRRRYGLCPMRPSDELFSSDPGLEEQEDGPTAMERGTAAHSYLPLLLEDEDLPSPALDQPAAVHEAYWLMRGAADCTDMLSRLREMKCFDWERRVSSSPFGVPSVAQVDWLSEDKDGVWINDLKTTRMNPNDWVLYSSFDFQPLHYYHVLREAGVDVKGFRHWVLQAPSFRFSREDRDYDLVEFTPKTGPNAGVTRLEKKWVGDPKWENYGARIREWMTCTERYSAKSRMHEPVLLVSSTTSTTLERQTPYYRECLEILHDACTRPAVPSKFPLLRWSAGSPWELLHTCPAGALADRIRTNFRVTHRDKEIT